MLVKYFLADDLLTLRVTIQEMREEGWEPDGRFFMVPAWHRARRFYVGEPQREPTVGIRMKRTR